MIVSTTLKICRILFFAIFFSLSFISFGQSISEEKAFTIAESFLNNSNSSNVKIDRFEKITQNSNVLGYVFNFKPYGFVIISSSIVNNPVIGFSFTNNFTFNENNIDVVSSFLLSSQEDETINQNIEVRNPNSETIGPLIRSLYGQVNCLDENDKLINVSNLFTPHNYAPGCVAISLSTLLHYYQWPIIGEGSHTYKDKYGSSKGTYSVDFEKAKFDWENILERYEYKKTTKIQKEALGELVYNTAVALDMDFEYNGSTSNVNRIPKTGEKYFRFIAKEVPASSFIFWKVVDSNLVHNIPVIFSISASNGAGHSIVCDGFKFKDGTEYHHVNMGWWGNSNGWYKIKSGFKVGGYNKINHGIIDFLPVPMLLDPVINEDSSQLTVFWKVSEVIYPDRFELQIKKDDEGWSVISDTIKVDSLIINIDNEVKEYRFRVRSKMNGKWYKDSWSNSVTYKRNSTNTVSLDLNTNKVFPNPFKDILYIEGLNDGNLTIYDITGKKTYQKFIKNDETINTSEWLDGMYLLKFIHGEKIKTLKLNKIK